jgi:hypothetical protein
MTRNFTKQSMFKESNKDNAQGTERIVKNPTNDDPFATPPESETQQV